jgi:hypothetical protein
VIARYLDTLPASSFLHRSGSTRPSFASHVRDRPRPSPRPRPQQPLTDDAHDSVHGVTIGGGDSQSLGKTGKWSIQAQPTATPARSTGARSTATAPGTAALLNEPTLSNSGLQPDTALSTLTHALLSTTTASLPTLPASPTDLDVDLTCAEWGSPPPCTCKGLSDTYGEVFYHTESPVRSRKKPTSGKNGVKSGLLPAGSAGPQSEPTGHAPVDPLTLWAKHRCNTRPSWCKKKYVFVAEAKTEPTPSAIPHDVWQTGPQSEFADVQVLVKHNRKLLPNDTTFHYFNDDSRDLSMHNLSVILASEGVVNGSYDAYMDLVPFAFRADLWRAAMVWVHGGIYLDHKMVLKQPYVAPFVV